jgi:hypothetical protein
LTRFADEPVLVGLDVFSIVWVTKSINEIDMAWDLEKAMPSKWCNSAVEGDAKNASVGKCGRATVVDLDIVPVTWIYGRYRLAENMVV